MSEEKNITNVPGPMDYAGLRDYGLEYIRNIASRHWTDFSPHDPGVTILEALTLALNDLSYRASASMSDLLTRPGGNRPSLEGTMFPANVILGNAPTTVEDYRKLVLENIPGVRNIFFTCASKPFDVPDITRKLSASREYAGGYYNVKVELENLDTIFANEKILSIIGRNDDGSCVDHIGRDNYIQLYTRCIRRLFLQNRNLCENILDISFTPAVAIGICAEIEIESDVDVRGLLQKIYDRMAVYVSPTIPFHTIESLLASGRHPDEIFSVRSPRLGFIDRTELAGFTKRTDLYASDVISLLMDIEGIRSVRHISFMVDQSNSGRKVTLDHAGRHVGISYNCAQSEVSFNFSNAFLRNKRLSNSIFANDIVFLKNGLSFLPPEGGSGIYVTSLHDERQPLPEGFSTAPPLPESSYRGTDRYFSFQNLLPATYRMGVDTLPESASSLRKAERTQLKAYLTFFDQLLSDYLAQIDRFQDLLSVNGNNQTYFHHKMDNNDIVDISKVLVSYPDYPVGGDDEKTDLSRKNAILNYLLSRFADSFAEYSALEFLRAGGSEEFSFKECVEDKKRFLADYPRISALRSCGVDWTLSGQISGAERRILRKLGVNSPDEQSRISDGDLMGLHLLEHSLLLPQQEGDAFLELSKKEGRAALLSDPYSFRVTAVLPGWTSLTRNLYYRNYVENIIREEVPAHIFVKVCWLSREAMSGIEDAWSRWLAVLQQGELSTLPPAWNEDRKAALAAVVEAFAGFSNVYEVAVLMPDEMEDYADGDGITRLDYTYLGSEDVPTVAAPVLEPTPGPASEENPCIAAEPEPVLEPLPEPVKITAKKRELLASLLGSLLSICEYNAGASLTTVKQLSNQKNK